MVESGRQPGVPQMWCGTAQAEPFLWRMWPLKPHVTCIGAALRCTLELDCRPCRQGLEALFSPRGTRRARKSAALRFARLLEAIEILVPNLARRASDLQALCTPLKRLGFRSSDL